MWLVWFLKLAIFFVVLKLLVNVITIYGVIIVGGLWLYWYIMRDE